MAGPLFPDSSPRPSAGKLAQAERVAILGNLGLFEGAAKRHLKDLAKATRLERFDRDQDLLTEGEASSSAFVIVAGAATVRRNGRKIAEIGPGDIVGELGLLGDKPRNASVRASGPTECLVLDRAALKRAVTDHPALGWHLLTTIADRLAD